MDPDLGISSRIQDPSLKPLQPLYVDSWASLHVNMLERVSDDKVVISVAFNQPY